MFELRWCVFYPGSRPGECRHGTDASFDEARRNFEGGWRVLLSKRIEADFQAWRDQEAWTAEKYRRFDRRACRRTGALVADRGQPFDDPIPFPRGRQLVTLQDAGNYITKLPRAVSRG
jgi:hypothetical protein